MVNPMVWGTYILGNLRYVQVEKHEISNSDEAKELLPRLVH
jgi:hypothetical protein